MPKAAETTIDVAAEAVKYGRIVALNEEATKLNAHLTTENDALTKSVAKNKEQLSAEQKAVADLGVEANMLRAQNKRIAQEKTTELDEREAKLKTREQAVTEKEKAQKAVGESLKLREDNVTAKESKLTGLAGELKAVKTELDIRSGTLDEQEKMLIEANDAFNKRLNEEKAVLKEQKQVLKDTEKARDQIVDKEKSVQEEVVKLVELTGKMRAENDLNAKLKNDIEAKIPVLGNLIVVLREFHDYIVANVNNPDAITNKFNEVSKQLDVTLSAPAEVSKTE